MAETKVAPAAESAHSAILSSSSVAADGACALSHPEQRSTGWRRWHRPEPNLEPMGTGLAGGADAVPGTLGVEWRRRKKWGAFAAALLEATKAPSPLGGKEPNEDVAGGEDEPRVWWRR
jgi:hypothetical protein